MVKALIDQKKYVGSDPYGVPILPFEESIRAQVEIGLGPLHTQYDEQGNAYTSLFLESKVAKWNVAEARVIEKIPAHYNVGHIAAAEGDTVSPDGRFLVMINKWAIDRFSGVGPLLPQNMQLVDITSNPMQLLYDMPVPIGEPHYAQIIKADKLAPIDIYTPVGTDPITNAKAADAVEATQERVERRPDGVHVYMTAVRSHFTPDIVRVKEGEKVFLHLTNVEQAKDATHGFAIGSHNVNVSIEPGEHADIEFLAARSGVFPMYCTEFCSALHLEMAGYLLVEPK
jgi:nitrous-oxide reductase